MQYVFVFEHDEDGNISLASLEDGKGRARPAAKKPTIFSAKKEVSSLLRNIVYVTSTLGNIPEERYVFMKMEFSDDCPENYQPSGFCDAGDNAVGFFSTKPFSM
jgi:HORMA domain